MSKLIENRYEFVLLFDVQDGNPNGDPDAGNLPRIDAETGHGLVTDVCLKRKIRNYISVLKNGAAPFEIYVKEKAVLNNQHKRAYQALGIDTEKKPDSKKNTEKSEEARMWMCKNFFDIRTFGAVMSTGDFSCGQVRGPVQITFARSIDPVVSNEHTITRMAVTTEKEAAEQGGDNRTMGRKFTIPYGLYRCHGFISAHLAETTGFTEEDLELLFSSLVNMFDIDRSAARGQMQTRGLYVFRHDSALGNAPAHTLLDRIKIERKLPSEPARRFEDYNVLTDSKQLPNGVTLIERGVTAYA